MPSQRSFANSLRILFGAGVFGASAATPSGAQSTDSVRQLSPGLAYRHIQDTRGPWSIHVVQVQLRRADIELLAARAGDQLRGRERPSAMAQRISTADQPVRVAVNADFFDLKTGENENNQVVNGEWWKGLKVTESPYDTYDNIHVQFALDSARRPLIERFILDAKTWVRGAMTPIININAIPTGAIEGTTLYSWRFGASTPRDTTRATAEAPLIPAGRRGDTLLFIRRGPVSNTSGSSIPTNGAVLAGYGGRTKDVQAMADGDTARVWLSTLPRLKEGAKPALILGGWPRILRDGTNVAGDVATVEGTISRNAEARHPRTAIGYSKDGKTLWLLVVDGRLKNSVGMTLVELADAMKRLGAWQAMNFDGGGSSTMVIDGSVVNVPSDTTGERAVGNALLILQRKRSRP